ncbi:beta-galactosidase [Nakamurella antarctica]|uniref:Beta-galactosidase n=1 Tax=Nakamurella antarctica TaxID=1902245 RepID=A0A3G8ZJ07_9ACTN|nr:beta-galactosidase [Nakamurella antarctica]AZI56825.1 beta-galactosidase [Nakamurella antarctica]
MNTVTGHIGGLAYGGDYNPEQWDREVWLEDVALMREAGVNLVTVGVFSWALLEPSAGVYQFDWLDEIVDLLHANGIAVDLATSTASPPPWFTINNPQARLVDAFGSVRVHGGRQAFCPSSPEYRAASVAMASEMVRRYAGHPAVVMWHINNEYGCQNFECFCPQSAASFRVWLGAKYGTLEELNRCWGTNFWSQRYGQWDQILPPSAVSYNSFINPTQQLDWKRFTSSEFEACYLGEAAELRAHARQPVTTNFMSFFEHVDYFAFAEHVDIVSNDDYLLSENVNSTHYTAMTADLMRSLAKGKPWLLMEHSTSAVNWQNRNQAKGPGEMRRNSLQHIARGSDGALFFQWRASKAGAEKYHSALLPHAGTNSTRWREVVEFGANLKALAAVAGSTVAPASTAILYDWNSVWALNQKAHPSVDYSVMDQVQRWHHEMYRRNVGVDFLGPGADLAGYKLLLIPGLYLVDQATSDAVAEFVRGGGTVLVSYFSGTVDENDHIWLGGYPGAFREVLGVTVEEFSPLPVDGAIELTEFGSGTIWSETARADSAEVLAQYVGGNVTGSVALTCNSFGAGKAYYVGTELGDTGRGELFDRVLGTAGIVSAEVADGVEVVVRRGETASWTFVINHSDAAAKVSLPGRDLLGDGSIHDSFVVPAGGVSVLENPA